jgi:hypothetical protein
MAFGKAELSPDGNASVGTIDGTHDAANYALCRIGHPGQLEMLSLHLGKTRKNPFLTLS